MDNNKISPANPSAVLRSGVIASSVLAVVIAVGYFLAMRTGNQNGIFYALLIASFLRTVAITVYYYCGGWKKAVAKFEAEHAKEV